MEDLQKAMSSGTEYSNAPDGTIFTHVSGAYDIVPVKLEKPIVYKSKKDK